MGSKASKPARRLTKTIVNQENVAAAGRAHVQLPTQAMKDHFENPQEKPQEAPKPAQAPATREFQGPSSTAGPEGKDGMDPQADQNYINFINNLGRQIHSHQKKALDQEGNIVALKQLLNRKKLYEKGQHEVKAQLGALTDLRTMVHPRTLTGVINALNDKRSTRENISKDYQVSEQFLDNMSRLKVAHNIVVIEETTKEDEIGPKMGQPAARAATEPSIIDYDGDMTETVNKDRLRELQKRLE